MSRSVDERVVELRFDSDQFQKGAGDALNTIGKLDKGLRFDGVKENLSKVSSIFAKINLGSFGEAIDNISSKFSVLGVIAATTISNITNKIVNMGMKIANAIPTQIIQGGIKRAMNIENAHFMLQGLLEDETQVQAVMDKAGKSVENTAYSYDAAAKAAAQFTASGLTAQQLVSPLRAITGVAAMTNAEYEDISRIFTTVAGNGRLMGDQLLQLSGRGLNAASTIADYFNKVKDGSIAVTSDNEALIKSIKAIGGTAKTTEADIRDMVSKGKINFEIFSAAMDDAFGAHALKANETLTGAFSNVKAALSRIGAEFISPLIEQNGPLVKMINSLRILTNDVKKQVGPFANAFVKAVSSIANAITKLTSIHWEKDTNGKLVKVEESLINFKTLFEGFTHILDGVVKIVTQFKNAFKDIFPGSFIDNVNEGISKFEKFTRVFEIKNWKDFNNIKSIFKGFFSVIDIGIQIISALWKNITPLFKSFSGLGKGIFESAGSLGEWLTNLSKSLRETDFFNEKISLAIQKLQEFKEKLVGLWESFRKGFYEVTGIDLHIPTWEELVSIFEDLKNEAGPVGTWLGKIKKAIIEIGQSISKYLNFETLSKAFHAIGTALGNIGKFIIALAKKLAEVFAGLGEAIKEFFANASRDEVMHVTGGIFDAGVLAGLLYIFKNLSTTIQKLTGGFNKFYGLIGEGGLAGHIQAFLDTIRSTMVAFQNEIKSKQILNIALAIGALALSVILLASIDQGKVYSATFALSLIMGQLFTFMELSKNLMTSGETAKMAAFASVLVALGVSMLTLSLGIKILSTISWNGIAKGLAVLAVSLLGISAAGIAISKSGATKSLLTMSVAMLALGQAMMGLAIAFMMFNFVKPESITKGLNVMVASLVSLALASSLISAMHAEKALVTLSLAMHSLAGAMLVLSVAFLLFGKVSDAGIENGLNVMIGAITALSLAASLISMTGASGSLMALSGALAILSIAMIQFGLAMKIIATMSWADMAKGLVVFAVALGALVAVAVIFGEFAPMMMMVAGAMALLGAAIMAIGIGILAINIGFNIFIASLLLLASISAATAAAIVTAFQIMILGVVATLPAIATGIANFIAALITGIATNIEAIVNALKKIAKALIKLFADLIPDILNLIGDLIIGICDLIIKTSPHIADAIIQIIKDTIRGIKEIVPELTEALWEILLAFQEQATEYLPDIVDLFMQMLVDILDGIANKIDDIVNAAYDIVIAFMDAIGEKVPDVVEAGIQMVINFIEGTAQAIEEHTEEMKQAIEHLINAMLDMGIAVIEGMINPFAERGKALMESGFVKGIKEKIDLIKEKIREGLDKAISKAREFINKFKAIGQSIMNSGLVQGIKQHVSAIWDKIKGGVQGALDKLKGFVDKFKNVGIEMMNGLASGLRPDKVIQKVANVGNEALAKIKGILGIASPSKEFAWVGRMAMEGLIVGIDKMSGKVNNETSQIGSSMLEELGKALQYATDELNNYDFNPTIRPVVDMSDVWSAEGDISNIFSSRGIDARVSDISARIDGINGIDKLGNNLSDISNLNNKKLLEAMDKQNKAFEDMSNRLDKMQVVLDSGELVGGISSKMDNALGSRAVYAGRMNA